MLYRIAHAIVPWKAVTIPAIVLVTGAFCFSTHTTEAGTIFLDTFSRTGSLLGSNTDTGQTWFGSGGLQTNGSELVINTNSPQKLGVTFFPDRIYELSIDLSVNTGGNYWISFGYTDTNQNNSFTANRGAILHRQDPQIQTFSLGNSGAQTFGVTNSFPKSLSIVLETGTTLANSTLKFKVNGLIVGTGTTDASTINGVFIQANGGTGTADNFQLTVVPEPSSLATLSIATVTALWGWCRRRGAVAMCGP